MTETRSEQDFLLLIKEYQNVIYKVCYIYSKDPDYLNDLYQETVINLWKSFPRFRHESKPSTWVCRIALNSCISFLRRSFWKPADLRVEAVMDVAIDDDDASLQIRELYGLINRLGPLEKALILLWLEEKSYAEISGIMGLSQSNVATRLSRVKDKLKKMSDF